MNKWNELCYSKKIALVRFYPKEALIDSNWTIRRAAYRSLGYTAKALTDNNCDIRLEAYRSLGYTAEALIDDDWAIRIEAYRSLGYTAKALTDNSSLGYTAKALTDNSSYIREEAEIYLNFIANKKVTIEVTQHELDIINKIREDKKG